MGRAGRGIAAGLALALAACTAPTDHDDRAHAAAAAAATATATAPPQAPSQAPAPGAVSVPTAFQGEWQADPAHCGSALDDSRLRIGPDTMQYHESRGPVRAAVANGDELALIVELSGEGETWLKTEHFRLSPDRNALSSLDAGGTAFVRHRCGSGAQ